MFAHVTITHQQQVHNLRELPMKCLSRNHLSYSPLRLHPGMDDLSLFEMNLCQQWVYECTHICNWWSKHSLISLANCLLFAVVVLWRGSRVSFPVRQISATSRTWVPIREWGLWSSCLRWSSCFAYFLCQIASPLRDNKLRNPSLLFGWVSKEVTDLGQLYCFLSVVVEFIKLYWVVYFCALSSEMMWSA